MAIKVAKSSSSRFLRSHSSVAALCAYHGGRRSHSRGSAPAPVGRFIQLQLTLLYGSNAIAKSTSSYLSGDILMAMSISISNFKVDMSNGFLELGPITIPVILAGAGSVLIEYFLALGFWLGRWKWVVAVVGVGFHLSLLCIMQIFKLDLAAIFLYLAFILPLLPRKTKPTSCSSNEN